MMKKILTIGSLTQDIFLKPRRQEVFSREGEKYLGFCLGDKIRIQETHETFGGGGANLAVGLSRFGIPVSVLGKVGTDSVGESILNNLEKEEVQTAFVQKDTHHRSGFSTILSSDSGERVVLFSCEANDSFCDFDVRILNHFDAVCLQHLSGCSQNIFLLLQQYFLQNPKKFLSWNPGRKTLEKGVDSFLDILPVIDVLFLNQEEAFLFTQKQTAKDVFSEMYQKGFLGNMVITNGRKGAVGCDGKNIHTTSVLEGRGRVDTLGAGDSFLSGLVGGILTKKNLLKSMKLGTINAAHVVEHFGSQAGLQAEKNLEKYINHIDTKTQSFSF